MRLVRSVYWIIFCLFFYSLSWAEVDEKIVAIVGNEVITHSELEDALKPVYKQYQALFKGKELAEKCKRAREEILNQMIKDKLILQEAKKLNITVEDEAVEAKLKEMIDKFPSEEKFFEALKNEGLTLDALREKYREQLIIRKLTNIEVRAKITLGPQEILDYYNAHLEEFTEPEQVRLKTILIRVRKGDDEEAIRARLEEIMSMLKEGMDFGRLALICSEGPEARNRGDLGFIEKGQLLEDIDRVVFGLKPGEISEPIRTNVGYHIFKVEAKKKARVKEFNEVREEIEDKLFQQKAVARFNEWMAKLRENAYISIK